MAVLVGGMTPDPTIEREMVYLWDSQGVLYEGALGYPDRIEIRDPVGNVYGREIDWAGHRIESTWLVWYIPRPGTVVAAPQFSLLSLGLGFGGLITVAGIVHLKKW